MFPVFSLLGNPLIDMDLRNACTCIESTLLYSCTFPQTCVFRQRLAQDLALAIRRVKEEFTACGVHIPGHPRGISPLKVVAELVLFFLLSSADYPIRRCTIQFVPRQHG